MRGGQRQLRTVPHLLLRLLRSLLRLLAPRRAGEAPYIGSNLAHMIAMSKKNGQLSGRYQDGVGESVLVSALNIRTEYKYVLPQCMSAEMKLKVLQERMAGR